MDYMSPYMKALHKIKTEAKAFRLISSTIIIGSVALLIIYLTAKEFFEVATMIIGMTLLSIIIAFEIKKTNNAKYLKEKNIVEINKNFIKKKIIEKEREILKKKIENKNNYIQVKKGTKCPIKECEITSPKCQKCDDYINHEIADDHHGRINYYLISCKYLNTKNN